MASDAQEHTLRHMLGINTPWLEWPAPYRNYAAVTPGNLEYLELEALGLVERYRRAAPASGYQYDYYRCTEAGRTAAMASYHGRRYSRGKRRYHAFLTMRDVEPDLTFREFLTDDRYRSTRLEGGT